MASTEESLKGQEEAASLGSVSPNPLRAFRHNRKLTAVQVARMLGVSERSILAWEKGAFNPSEKAYEKLAQLMGVPDSDIRNSWDRWKMVGRI